MTYEHGKAPAEAPVVYVTGKHGFVVRIERRDGTIITTDVDSPSEAELICQMFHLAKLAGEARSLLCADPLADDLRFGWMCRYDAAKGEA